MHSLSYMLLFVALIVTPSMTARGDQAQRVSVSDESAACCKTCRKGKACGNSCISRLETCRQPRGCACDAD